ncbi:signal peptidase II [Escherichia coli]
MQWAGRDPGSDDVSLEGHAKLNNIAYALIIGGALGNLSTACGTASVVDMIGLYVSNWRFATFTLPILPFVSVRH